MALSWQREFRCTEINNYIFKSFLVFLFLVGYVEEGLWWPIQSRNIGGKKKLSS